MNNFYKECDGYSFGDGISIDIDADTLKATIKAEAEAGCSCSQLEADLSGWLSKQGFVKLDDKESTTVLAALRFFQASMEKKEDTAWLREMNKYYFCEHDPLEDVEIDSLCKRLKGCACVE